MSPHLLICVEKPKTADERNDRDWPLWRLLLERSTRLLSEPGTVLEKPTENVWLLPLNESLLLATKLIALCEDSELPYKIYLLNDAPKECK